MYGNSDPVSPAPQRERFIYTKFQLDLLNSIFSNVRYPNTRQKQIIGDRVGITREQVKIWFQNRRRKEVTGQHAAADIPHAVHPSLLNKILSQLFQCSDEHDARSDKKSRNKGSDSRGGGERAGFTPKRTLIHLYNANNESQQQRKTTMIPSDGDYSPASSPSDPETANLNFDYVTPSYVPANYQEAPPRQLQNIPCRPGDRSSGSRYRQFYEMDYDNYTLPAFPSIERVDSSELPLEYSNLTPLDCNVTIDNRNTTPPSHGYYPHGQEGLQTRSISLSSRKESDPLVNTFLTNELFSLYISALNEDYPFVL